MPSYKDTVDISKRITDSNAILSKYPDYVPVIIECDDELSKLLKKKKYLIPSTNNISLLLYTIRGKITLGKEKAMFMFCDNTLLCLSETVGEVYAKYKVKNVNDLNQNYH